MAGVRCPSDSGSSSSSAVFGGVNVSLISSIPGERLVNPNCSCGSPSSLKISWTDLNPGRRFFKCNRCNFFLWVDPKVNWYSHVIKYLLQRNSALVTDVLDTKSQMILTERDNRRLQEGLDEYIVKIEEHGIAVEDIKSEVEKMRSGQKVYKMLIGALVVLVVVFMKK